MIDAQRSRETIESPNDEVFFMSSLYTIIDQANVVNPQFQSTFPQMNLLVYNVFLP